MISVQINDREIRSSLERIAADLERPTALYAKVGRHMRDYVRQTITIQGRGSPWAPLSSLTKRRSGKFKAMLSLRDRIFYTASNRGLIVGFNAQSSDRFTIRQLEVGWSQPAYTKPGRGPMVIRMARGGNPVVFKKRRGFTVPGRKVFPGVQEAQREIRDVALEHYQELVRRK